MLVVQAIKLSSVTGQSSHHLHGDSLLTSSPRASIGSGDGIALQCPSSRRSRFLEEHRLVRCRSLLNVQVMARPRVLYRVGNHKRITRSLGSHNRDAIRGLLEVEVVDWGFDATNLLATRGRTGWGRSATTGGSSGGGRCRCCVSTTWIAWVGSGLTLEVVFEVRSQILLTRLDIDMKTYSR